MNSLMMAQMGLGGMETITSFMEARGQAQLERKLQKYRNTLTKIGAARQMNAVTVNESRLQGAAIEADAMIQRTSIVDQGKAAVAAAAAGVSGNSVDMVINDLKGSAGRASYAQRRHANQQLAELGEQRKSIAIGAIVGQDMQVIPRPSTGAMLLGLGTNMLSIYDSHQPEGSRLLG